MEVCFLSINDKTLVGSGTSYLILKLSFDLNRCYIVLYFLPKMSLLLPTNYEIEGLVFSQDSTNIHESVPTSLVSPATNLYTSVVVFIDFRRLVESTLNGRFVLALGLRNDRQNNFEF